MRRSSFTPEEGRADREPEVLFVYGTLRPGAPMHGLLEGRARWLGRARAPGCLVDLGEFPGLVPAERAGDRVEGDLFAPASDGAAALLDALDRYEGASFRREADTVEGPDGPVVSWLYRYLGDVRGRPRIAGGDYLASRAPCAPAARGRPSP